MSRTSTSRCATCPARSHLSRHTLATRRQWSLFEDASLYEIGPTPQVRRLREAIAQYLCLDDLRRLATDGEDIQAALRGIDPIPDEVQALLSLLGALLAPTSDESIRSPSDIAALLMTEMGCLDHEEFWVICLDTANHVQRILPLYRGTLNSSGVRVGEIFRQAIALNSNAIVVAHNHPSGCTTPSPEDQQLTQQLREAGRLLDIALLDHLIIAQGRWLSLREQRPGEW